MAGRYPLRNTRYRAEVEERLKRGANDIQNLSDDSSDGSESDSDISYVKQPRRKLQRRRRADDSDSELSVSDSVVHDEPPRRVLNVHDLRKKRGPPAGLAAQPATFGDRRRVTRSMTHAAVIDLGSGESSAESSDESSDEEGESGEDSNEKGESVGESSEDDEYDVRVQAEQPETAANQPEATIEQLVFDDPPPMPPISQVDVHADPIMDDEQRNLLVFMQMQAAAEEEAAREAAAKPPVDMTPAADPPLLVPPPAVENIRIFSRPEEVPMRTQARLPTAASRKKKQDHDIEQARLNAWINTQTAHAPIHKIKLRRPQPPPPPPPPPQPAPQPAPRPPKTTAQPANQPTTQPTTLCFTNFYYTVGATSYMCSMQELKAAIMARLLKMHPDKMPPGTVYDPRDIGILTFIKNKIFNSDENRMKYNRLISSPYYAHGSGDNTDIEAMREFMEGKYDFYQPFANFIVKNHQLAPLNKDMHKLYPADELPPAPPGAAYGGGARIASLANTFMRQAQPFYGSHYGHAPYQGGYGAHSAAMNGILRAHQPQGPF